MLLMAVTCCVAYVALVGPLLVAGWDPLLMANWGPLLMTGWGPLLVAGWGLPATWCPASCGCYNGWASVDCSGRGLGAVPVLPALTEQLYLDHNQLEYLLPGTFAGTPDLVTLSLDNNELTLVDTTSFANLHVLQALNLSSNQIIVFKSMAGSNLTLTRLHSLDLSNNQLQTVPRNLSLFAPNLHVLRLQGNLISSAWLDSSYSLLTQLRHLDLGTNRIRQLRSYHLDSLRQGPVHWLGLSRCHLEKIEVGALAGLTNLTTLCLSENPLSASELSGALATIARDSRISQLEIGGIRLGSLPDAVSAVNTLEVLDASNCSLGSLPADALARLPRLHSLRLQHNFISVFNNTRLAALRHLNLSHNVLTSLTLAAASLEWLDVSHNRLRALPAAWLGTGLALRVVDVRHNQLRSMHPHALAGSAVHALYLDYNALTSLHTLGSHDLRHVTASHNHISYIEANTFKEVAGFIENIDLSHNALESLPGVEWQDFDKLLSMDLSRNRLGKWFGKTDLNCSFFTSIEHVQVLDVSYNNISKLPLALCRHLSHVTLFQASGNVLSDIRVSCVDSMISLAKLDLSSNRFKYIDTTSFYKLVYLDVVDLRTNPFECNCKLSPFLHWVNFTQVTLTGLEEGHGYVCHAPPSLVGAAIKSYPAVPCSVSAEGLRRDVILFIATVTSVSIATMLLALLANYCNFFQYIKTLHYRWQARYRTVASVEFGDSFVPV